MEIRTLDYVAPIGGFALDVDSPRGAIYLKITTFNMPDYDIPRFMVDTSDDFWYDFYVQQFRALWEAGEEVASAVDTSDV